MSLNLQDASGLTAILGNATLSAQTGGAATFTTLAFPYAIKGVAYTNAAVTTSALTSTSDIATGVPTTFTAPASGYYTSAILLWCVNAAGEERTILGPKKTYAVGDANASLEFPSNLPDTWAPFAYNTLRAGSTVSGTWTLGSSNWNATGMTASAAVNLCMTQSLLGGAIVAP